MIADAQSQKTEGEQADAPLVAVVRGDSLGRNGGIGGR